MATRIRIKRGTESQITGYTGPHLSGELAYATNTGNVFVSDGTAFISIGGGGGETPTLQSVTDEGNTTTNSIGIGTATPGYPLHIVTSNNSTVLGLDAGSAARFRFAGNSTSGYTSTFNINDTGLDIGHDSTSRSLNLKTGNQDRITILGAGNVGIGTTAPDDRLTIAGGNVSTKHIGYATDALKITHNSNDVLLSLYKRSSQSSPDVQIRTNGNSYINGGNVGIGTTTPSTALHVKGTLAGQGYMTIENTVHVAKLQLKSSIYTGNLVMDGTGGYISGGGLILDSGTNPRIQFLQSGASKMSIVSGNVGIGITAPTHKLEVNGDIGVQLGDNLRWGSQLGIRKDSNGELNFFAGTNSTSGGFNFRGWTGSAYESSTLVIRNNGNVGIGATTPLAKLHVKDGNTLTTALSNTSALIEGFSQSILQVASHSTGYSQLAFGDQDDGFDGGLIYSNASRYLAIEAANVERMRFTSDGNVGIGTTAPATGLHVHSTSGIRSESPGNASVQIMRNDNAQYSALLRYYSGNSEKWVAGLTDAGDFTGSTGQEFMVGPLKTTPYLLINSGGNVAIGKETANFLLDVGDGVNNTFVTKRNPNGNIYIGSSDNTRFGFAGGQVNLGFATGGENNNVPLALGTFSNAQPLILGTDNLERVRIDGPTGNVGIGTTAPAHALHINKDNPYIQIQDSSASSRAQMNSGIIMKDSTGAQSFGITHSSTADVNIRANAGDLSLGTFAGTVIKLDGSNVGIGTTAPSGHLHVIDSGNLSSGGVFIENTGTTSATLGLENTEGISKLFTNNGITTLRNTRSGFSNYSVDIGVYGVKIKEGNGTQNAHASAILDLDSTTQGVLFPRMTELQKDSISSPATGLIIYQTDAQEGLYIYKSSGWTQII